MKKNGDVHIKMTTEQKKELESSAEQAGLGLSSYCRYILLKTKPRIQIIEKD